MANPIGNNLHLLPGQKAVVPRSRVNLPNRLKTTFPHGRLVPIYCNQALPGQSFDISTKSFIRLATPLTATMDDLVADIAFYFVPNRIIFDDFEKFMGITEDGTWATSISVVAPYIYASASGVKYTPNDLAPYLGVWPANRDMLTVSNVNGLKPSALPIRAYCQIWNDHYRDPNFEKIIPFSHGSGGMLGPGSAPSSSTLDPTSADTWYNYIHYGFGLAPVSKSRDLFTTCFTTPQKGIAVRIPTGDTFKVANGSMSFGVTGTTLSSSQSTLTIPYPSTLSSMKIDSTSLGTINALREAFAIQKYEENDMQNRYKDSLLAHFGVTNHDDVLQMAQYLGGDRINITMNTVVQNTSATVSTSSGDVTTPAGYVAGQSATFNRGSHIRFTANEHGWVIGVVCTRILNHSYSQGVNPQFLIDTRYNLYSPEFSNLPLQAVQKSSIFADAGSLDTVFGYNSAWWQYRFRPNRNTGYFATQVTGTLDYWHYGDYFASAPTLSRYFLRESSYQLDRTLAISSDTATPYLADFYFDEVDILPMPSESIPGLPIHA